MNFKASIFKQFFVLQKGINVISKNRELPINQYIKLVYKYNSSYILNSTDL